jgi:NAD(P)-dependent dehydrogenase (short-subunit alcohol dehydrogenase family)
VGQPDGGACADERVLVIGGAGGIGAAVAGWFTARGATVCVADLTARLTAGDPATRSAASSVAIDICAETSVVEAFQIVQERHGAPSIVVNAAGVTGAGPVQSMSTEEWNRVLATNLTGCFLIARQVIPAMQSLGRGKLVFMSSVNARTGGNELSGAAYAAAKAGIEALTRHLARHLAPTIQVNAVAPGPVMTPMLARLTPAELDHLVSTIPAGRYASAEEIAETVGFLCSPSSDFITGVTLHQNGGQWMG